MNSTQKKHNRMSTSCCFTPRLTGISTKFNNAFLQKKGKRQRDSQNYKKERKIKKEIKFQKFHSIKESSLRKQQAYRREENVNYFHELCSQLFIAVIIFIKSFLLLYISIFIIALCQKNISFKKLMEKNKTVLCHGEIAIGPLYLDRYFTKAPHSR